jgi:hypothetical protein
MADTPKPQGEVDPSKRPGWLKEVHLDAEFNYNERVRQQEERAAFEARKREILQPSEQSEKDNKDAK